MRTTIVPPGVKHLEYEIRQIVEAAHRIAAAGVSITWENIGDPIEMGEPVTPWIREIVQELVAEDRSWGYCPSRGVNATREFLAEQVNVRGGAQINRDGILFVNGIADAVDKIYDLVQKDARIIMPAPSYPTHSSNEAKRGEYGSLTFRLDPNNRWQPDLEELRNRVKYNPQIVAIAFVHPDNPTGMMYTPESMREIVNIAREYKLFLICDEIYSHICYNGAKTLHLSSLVEDVPALSLRGISKEYPWPGARCGWLEILNTGKDADFDEYVRALVNAKMMEVCSTTLPQMSIPRVYSDPRFPCHLKERAAVYERRAAEAYDTFAGIEGLTVNRPDGAFYFPVVFNPGVLTDRQTLPIENPKVRELVEGMVKNVKNDKRFVYYLIGHCGICVTPLSGFNCQLDGFRMTLLQHDDAKRRQTLAKLREAVRAYLAS